MTPKEYNEAIKNESHPFYEDGEYPNPPVEEKINDVAGVAGSIMIGLVVLGTVIAFFAFGGGKAIAAFPGFLSQGWSEMTAELSK